jgi:hypothetical protein
LGFTESAMTEIRSNTTDANRRDEVIIHRLEVIEPKDSGSSNKKLARFAKTSPPVLTASAWATCEGAHLARRRSRQ